MQFQASPVRRGFSRFWGGKGGVCKTHWLNQNFCNEGDLLVELMPDVSVLPMFLLL